MEAPSDSNLYAGLFSGTQVLDQMGYADINTAILPPTDTTSLANTAFQHAELGLLSPAQVSQAQYDTHGFHAHFDNGPYQQIPLDHHAYQDISQQHVFQSQPYELVSQPLPMPYGEVLQIDQCQMTQQLQGQVVQGRVPLQEIQVPAQLESPYPTSSQSLQTSSFPPQPVQHFSAQQQQPLSQESLEQQQEQLAVSQRLQAARQRRQVLAKLRRTTPEKKRELRRIKREAPLQQRRYLAEITPPRSDHTHPSEIVQKALARHPAPAFPEAISGHPDHPGYPSYTYFSGNDVTQLRHNRRLQLDERRRRLEQQQQQQQQQPLPETAMQLYTGMPSASPVQPIPPQQLQQPNQPEPVLGPLERKRPPTTPSSFTPAKKVRYTSNSCSPSDYAPSDRSSPFVTTLVTTPSNNVGSTSEHSSASHLPLLGPPIFTPEPHNIFRGQSTVSSGSAASSYPVRYAARPDFAEATVASASQSTASVVRPNSSISEIYFELTQIVGSASPATQFLPFGATSPVAKLLGEQPFVIIVKNLLASSNTQLMPLRPGPFAEALVPEQPVWLTAYLQNKTALASSRYKSRPAGSDALPQQFAVPDELSLHTYTNLFSAHILEICPLLQRCQLHALVARFQKHYGSSSAKGKAPLRNSAGRQVSTAIDLLVLALGSVIWSKLNKAPPVMGLGFYHEARAVLKSLTKKPSAPDPYPPDPSVSPPTMRQAYVNELQDSGVTRGAVPSFAHLVPSLDLVRVYLLGALFCGQMSWLLDAADFVEAAKTVILCLINRPSPGRAPGVALSAVNNRDMTSYDRHVCVLYWLCVQMEIDMGKGDESMLSRYQSIRVPESTTEQDDMVDLNPLRKQVQMIRQLNKIYHEAHVLRRPDDVVEETVKKMARPPSRASSPASKKSTATVREAVMHCEGLSCSVLGNFRPGTFHAGPPKMGTIAMRLVDTIQAYRDLLAGDRVLPNAFGTFMVQCRYLVLLFAVSRALVEAAGHISDNLIDNLVDDTLDTLQQVAGPSGVMEAARRVLQTMKSMLQLGSDAFQSTPVEPCPPPPSAFPVVSSFSASQHAHGTVPPDLFVHCPTFTTMAGPYSAVSTATTGGSFTPFLEYDAARHHMAMPPGQSPLVSPATSYELSPASATRPPGYPFFGTELYQQPVMGTSFMSTDSGYGSQQAFMGRPCLPVTPATPVPSAMSAPLVHTPPPPFDMVAFAQHLGFSGHALTQLGLA